MLVTRTAEDAVERVVVAGGEWVELVIVATRTRDRQTEEGFAEDIDHVIDAVGLLLAYVDGRMFAFAEMPKSGSDEGFVGAFRRVPTRCQSVARNLFAYELVVRQVGVERTNRVVAVPPGVGDFKIELVAHRLGIPREIEPVAAPTFAVMRRRQQPIDARFVRGRRLIREERIDLRRRRRQADEVERKPANQRSFGRR